MILVDANLLIYAVSSASPRHLEAKRWLDDQFAQAARVGLPWPSLLAFLRITTNPRIFSRPISSTTAWRQIEAWLAQESAWVPVPTPRHQAVLGALVDAIHPTGDLVPDAHLAALAIEHGLILCSSDRGFSRFRHLRYENP